jgi:hypothetical protein
MARKRANYTPQGYCGEAFGRDAEEPTAPVAGSREIAVLREELRALRLAMERASAA